LYDLDRISHAWKKFHEDFHPDASGPPVNIPWGPALDILEMTSYQWPGGNLDDHHEFQFVEGEYMKADEYYDLIDDPTGFFLTRYFPRTFGALKGFERTGCLPAVNEVAKIASVFGPMGTEEMVSAAQKMGQAADELLAWTAVIRKISLSLKAEGTPSYVGGYTKAPFDVIGDCLRGTRGVMTDMFRNRDLLIEACDRLVPFMIRDGINACNASGHVMLLMPLHKGADAFMSEKQFSTFYWPSLRKVIIGLTDAGIVPLLFAEGSYNKRLDLIGDLPAGTAVWWFESTDMSAAKKALERKCCISGNVPLDLLCTASPDAVRDCCRKLIDAAGAGGGFILSTGAGMQGARAENIKAMIEFSTEYGRY
jgi:uroporphyrinogen-III decarboxylase